MESESEKPFRISLKLKEGKSPHLYLTQIKVMMEKDTSLHPMMAKTFKMLKKTRTPYIMLAFQREVVLDPLNFRHFDRSVEPRGSWVCTIWSDDEMKQHQKDSTGHIKSILKFFESLGYELYNSQICSLEYVKSLEELTLSQINSQLEQRESLE